jgi:predicted transcriptional regulator
MANVYKNIQKTINASGSDVDMYESPSETTSIVKTIKLFNTHGSALDVTIKIFDASSTTDFEYDVANVTASDGVDVLTFNNILILEAGDKIKMQTTQTNVIKMTAAVLQTSRQ